MTERLGLIAAATVAALVVAYAHVYWEHRPQATFHIDSIFYEQTGLQINVGDPKTSLVELYDNYVLIRRVDGSITMVPMQRIHAIDARTEIRSADSAGPDKAKN